MSTNHVYAGKQEELGISTTIEIDKWILFGLIKFNGRLIHHVKFVWILLALVPRTHSEVKFKTLEPDVKLCNEVMFNSQTFMYSLTKLIPNRTYEVRVSYPASVPTEFTIRVHITNQSATFKSRHLLNIEKSVFNTESSTQGYVAEVVAHRVGFPYNRERLNDPVVFDIILESVHFGLTQNSWRMVLIALILCGIVFRYLVPAAQLYILNTDFKYEHQC